MNFDLTGLFQRQTQIPVTDQSIASVQSTSVKTESTSSVGNLSPGQIISGQVVAADADTVQVEVAPGSILQAKVEDGLSLLKGMSVSFEVSGISDKQVALRALFQNTANIATINKALDAAEIPQTADSTSMVNAMMKEGMPIDKSSLQAMYRQVMAHPEVSGADIVTMNRLEIPVTDVNVKQFSDYMNMQHQIRGSVETIADSLSNTLTELVSDGKTQEAAQLMKQMVAVFSPEGEQGSVSLDAMRGNSLSETGNVQITSNMSETGNAQIIPNTSETVNTQMAPNMSESAQNAAQPILTENGKIIIQDTMLSQEPVKTVIGGADDFGNSVQTGMQTLQEEMESLGMPSDKVQQFLNQQMSGKELLDFTNQLLETMAQKGNGMTEAQLGRLGELIQRPEIQNAVKELIYDEWLMTPEDVADKEKVSDFYSKLSQQSGKLAEVLKSIPGADQNLMNQVVNVQQNVDFMNQLNQTMSYVQLPLKLAGENAHGDLYVYTNKKHFADKDGNVSAFLHLDMDHLGPVDVYVAMQNQNVTTQFYLKDEEMLDFIHENIGILNDRLEQKGYQMNANFSVKSQPGNVMQEIVEDQCENVRIGTYSFDMRA